MKVADEQAPPPAEAHRFEAHAYWPGRRTHTSSLSQGRRALAPTVCALPNRAGRTASLQGPPIGPGELPAKPCPAVADVA